MKEKPKKKTKKIFPIANTFLFVAPFSDSLLLPPLSHSTDEEEGVGEPVGDPPHCSMARKGIAHSTHEEEGEPANGPSNRRCHCYMTRKEIFHR